MGEAKRSPQLNWVAAHCFTVAVAGIPLVVYLLRDEHLISRSGYAYILFAFPTTPLGILGGIGAMYGRLGLGMLLAIALDIGLWMVGISLNIAGVI